ncbi:hypothetical protein BV210_17840 (plasmid) [Halorientalis sp. IM1011]|uniref:asparagine synthase-related protein n=1 Tax=Halorientalis sp. IM1011 TaxID=1932360 RepID=UPI00097CD1BB|nr:asparagine synthase-related protein [Halorientalis sp. IM1011]AQL44632.1 hypothetical protein BV210_17840 [Halorientalis sp. IM1011]
MNTTLFGVAGDRETFASFADPDQFDLVLDGPNGTVGVADEGLGVAGRTSVHRDDRGHCVVWGEAFFRGQGDRKAAAPFFDAYCERGEAALADLNGSYLVYVDHDGEARVYTDRIRSWECYYTDAPGVRVFGTDAAQVAQTVSDPTPDWPSIRQFVHFGNVFGTDTVIEEVDRIPFDGYLGPDETGELRRFVYRPREFDHVAELAERLERALDRRSGLPGEVGLLLSAGYDSRIILSQIDGIDRCYSLGQPDGDEVAVAQRLTEQYDTSHEVLETDDGYLRTSPSIVRYTQGQRESLHIHHRGNDAEIDADAILHGMFFDTLCRGFFLPRDGVDLFGHTFPRGRLEDDPDPATHFADLIGCFPGGPGAPRDRAGLSDEGWTAYARETIEPAIENCRDRADSIHNAIDLLGIKLKPTLPFRTHLADNYVESFVACDAELLEWHLMTPPAYRTDEVYRAALQRIDGDILSHRPPDRPHDSYKLNQVEKFLRRTVPGLTPFDRPLPDRARIYNDNDMDEQLFPDHESLHRLSPRLKLRINDVSSWLDGVLAESVDPTDVLHPKAVL